MQFLETGPELASHYNDVIAPQDVATYGGLCALATFDRVELKASTPLMTLCTSRCFFLSMTETLMTLSLFIYFSNFAEQSYRQFQLPQFLRAST